MGLQITHPKIAVVGPKFANDSFCLEVVPNGDRMEMCENAAMFLRLLRIPFGVSEIELHCKMCRDCNMDEMIIKEHSVRLDCDSLKSYGRWIGDHIKDSVSDRVTLSVEFEVKSVLDDEGNEIDEKEWAEYGIAN